MSASRLTLLLRCSSDMLRSCRLRFRVPSCSYVVQLSHAMWPGGLVCQSQWTPVRWNNTEFLEIPYTPAGHLLLPFAPKAGHELERQKKEQEEEERRKKELTERQQKQDEELAAKKAAAATAAAELAAAEKAAAEKAAAEKAAEAEVPATETAEPAEVTQAPAPSNPLKRLTPAQRNQHKLCKKKLKEIDSLQARVLWDSVFEAGLPYIPELCLACNLPRFSSCLTCGSHWCDECRGGLEFCHICGDNSEEDGRIPCPVVSGQAGGSQPDAESNLAQVEVARVREFREKYHVLADEDFAFAFSSFEEAVLAGGDFLGQEWLRIRSEQDQQLHPAFRPAPCFAVPSSIVPRRGTPLGWAAVQRHADGQQAGALSHRAALLPLVSYGLSMDEHFDCCQSVVGQPTPLEHLPLLDDDLQFVAWSMATMYGRLAQFGERAVGALKELKRRWHGVSVHLRRFQSPAIQQVTASREIGLAGLLMILLSWADVTYPYGLISGLPAIGYAPHYGLFPVQRAELLTLWMRAKVKTGFRPTGRHSPISFDEALACVVVFWHHEWQEPVYQIYSSLLFGLPLAVTSFNRYSRFAEALGRRLLRGLVTAESYGLDYDFTEVGKSSNVFFWVRERLESKVATLISDARQSQVLTPSQASKLYGALNFLESGVFGRVGCGGFQPLKDHQYGRSSVLSDRLSKCFDVISAVLRARPRRQFCVKPMARGRVLVASDAALEGPRQGSGGFLLLWSPCVPALREAFVAVLPDGIYD
eukprot:s268_g16.t1